MSDDDTLDDTNDENRDIRQLREQAKQGKQAAQEAQEAKAELAALQRENAFRKVGIDPDDTRAKYFAKAYDGEMTPEAIRAEAEAAGILQTEQQTPADEQAAHQRMTGASTGADAQPTSTADDVIAELRNAKSADEITAIMERAAPGIVYYGDENSPPELINVIPRR